MVNVATLSSTKRRRSSEGNGSNRSSGSFSMVTILSDPGSRRKGPLARQCKHPELSRGLARRRTPAWRAPSAPRKDAREISGSIGIDHLTGPPAINDEFRSGDEPAVLANQKRRQSRDVLGFSDPAGGMERMLLLGRFRAFRQ